MIYFNKILPPPHPLLTPCPLRGVLRVTAMEAILSGGVLAALRAALARHLRPSALVDCALERDVAAGEALTRADAGLCGGDLHCGGGGLLGSSRRRGWFLGSGGRLHGGGREHSTITAPEALEPAPEAASDAALAEDEPRATLPARVAEREAPDPARARARLEHGHLLRGGRRLGRRCRVVAALRALASDAALQTAVLAELRAAAF